MKNAFGLLELLIVIIIALGIYFIAFPSKYGRNNPFEESAKIKSQQQMVDDKVKEIEDIKALKQQLENNLKDNN